MVVDASSVMAVSVVVTAVVGMLMIHSWRQNRMPALLWVGVADLLVAGGTAVPLASTDLGPFIDIANAAVLLGYGVFWGGIRAFEAKPARLDWALAGGIAWLVAAQIPLFSENAGLRAGLEFTIAGAYTTAAALTVARGRFERLVSRNAAIFLLAVHAVILAGRVPVAFEFALAPVRSITGDQLFAAFALEHLLFTVAAGFVLLAMVKERLEAAQKTKAYTDVLTDAPNRRAFFERGAALLKALPPGADQASLVLFDLDRFKALNDTHGHAAGDRALVAFAELAQAELRAKDLFARIGGEEFGCLLPGLGMADAVAAADRIRLALAARNGSAECPRVTVSAGVASAAACGSNLDAMLADADRALYEAKRRGRNRVEQSRLDVVATDPAEFPRTRPGSVVRAFRNRA